MSGVESINRTRVAAMAGAFLVCWSFADPASGARPKNFLVTFGIVSPAVAPFPDDLHVAFTFAGGGIGGIKNVAVAPPPAGIAVAGNTITVTWAVKLPPATPVTIVFTTQFGGIAFGGGNWTNDGGNIGNPISSGDIQIDEQEIPHEFPAVSQWGMAVLVLLLFAGGAIVFYRRRVATT